MMVVPSSAEAVGAAAKAAPGRVAAAKAAIPAPAIRRFRARHASIVLLFCISLPRVNFISFGIFLFFDAGYFSGEHSPNYQAILYLSL
jgi:hypothetical protein